MIKLLKVVLIRNSYCNTTSQSACLCKFRDTYSTPTFKTEVLHLVSNVQLVKGLLLQNERQIQYYIYLALLQQ